MTGRRVRVVTVVDWRRKRVYGGWGEWLFMDGGSWTFPAWCTEIGESEAQQWPSTNAACGRMLGFDPAEHEPDAQDRQLTSFLLDKDGPLTEVRRRQP